MKMKWQEILSAHPFYRKLFVRLTQNEKDVISKFLTENKHLPDEAFFTQVDYLFLYTQNKPKNWAIISEVLSIMCKNRSILEIE